MLLRHAAAAAAVGALICTRGLGPPATLTKPLWPYERPLRLSNGSILSVQCYDGKNLLINVFLNKLY